MNNYDSTKYQSNGFNKVIDFVDVNMKKDSNKFKFFFSSNTKCDELKNIFDLSLINEETQEKILDGASNLKDWVYLRPYCRPEIIEKCALKILKRNHLCLWRDYFNLSAEENILRYIFKTTLDCELKNQNPQSTNDFFIKNLPPLKALSTTGKVIEKAKALFNSPYFKVFSSLTVCVGTPYFCKLMLVRVTPYVIRVVNLYLSHRSLDLIKAIYQYKRYIFVPSSVGKYLSKKGSYLKKTFSTFKIIVSPFVTYSMILTHPNLTTIYFVYFSIFTKFKMHADRSLESEDLFINTIFY